jgi:hypothetical protein
MDVLRGGGVFTDMFGDDFSRTTTLNLAPDDR